ncbi:MAG TPA: hypothetical protein VF808_09160 [Ktedonobacterales bacterium]
MTEEDLQSLIGRLRKIHRAERRRAWWHGRTEPLALGGAFVVIAWLIWPTNRLESVCIGAFGLIVAAAALA